MLAEKNMENQHELRVSCKLRNGNHTSRHGALGRNRGDHSESDLDEVLHRDRGIWIRLNLEVRGSSSRLNVLSPNFSSLTLCRDILSRGARNTNLVSEHMCERKFAKSPVGKVAQCGAQKRNKCWRKWQDENRVIDDVALLVNFSDSGAVVLLSLIQLR
ncbi:hypothetical protein B0H19DRAFT_1057740 [Mycena capillaripes]|nr:hypothetical protein B0H19DRAFT_1057740 [Mycena capillaripes]